MAGLGKDMDVNDLAWLFGELLGGTSDLILRAECIVCPYVAARNNPGMKR